MRTSIVLVTTVALLALLAAPGLGQQRETPFPLREESQMGADRTGATERGGWERELPGRMGGAVGEGIEPGDEEQAPRVRDRRGAVYYDEPDPLPGTQPYPVGPGEIGGSPDDVLPPGSPRSTPPPDRRTGTYLPGSAGTMRYNLQQDNTGALRPGVEPGVRGGEAGRP